MKNVGNRPTVAKRPAGLLEYQGGIVCQSSAVIFYSCLLVSPRGSVWHSLYVTANPLHDGSDITL